MGHIEPKIRRANGPRACRITSCWFLVVPPLPPRQATWPRKMGYSRSGQSPSRLLGTAFFQSWRLPGAFQDVMLFCLRFLFEKTATINVFDIPKPLQNPSQNDLKSMSKKHVDFCDFLNDAHLSCKPSKP